MLPPLSISCHLALCPACALVLSARSDEAVQAAVADHVVASHGGWMLPNVRQ